MKDETKDLLAERVDTAAINNDDIVMLTAEHPEMTLEDAYEIQRLSITRRIQRGEDFVGMKMGLTSRAKMEQVGVHNPIYGHLTGTMKRSSGDTIAFDDYVHPRIEPEIAFILGQDLVGKVTAAEAMQAVSGVCAALEVIDSRYTDFKFTIIDVVADNASSSTFFLGDTVLPPELVENLGNLGMVMSVNGEVVETGSSAAIFEHPARSLAKLAEMLWERGEGLSAGMVVLAGGATKAVHLKPGDHVHLEVDSLSTVDAFVE